MARAFFSAMATRKRMRVTEKQVTLIWQQLNGEVLTATGGERIGVIYPGRVNDDSGPDFREAVITNRSRFVQGDVEVHTEAGDWRRHGHHLDTRYNDTVLHVALWPGPHSDTVLQSGRSVPTLCLSEALGHQAYLLPRPLPCSHISDRMGQEGVRAMLAAAGEARFRLKAFLLQNDIVLLAPKQQAGQALFQGMMRALGYSKNTKPFEELARRIPISYIESTESLLQTRALLLGTAGLLPSQRSLRECNPEGEISDLEHAWRSMQKSVSTMSHADWSFSHIYPNNSPVRRIIAQSYILDRHCRETGSEPPGRKLVSGLLRLVEESPVPGGHRVLESGLIVTGSGYWHDHFDFDVSCRTRKSVLLGSGKAGEIVTNVLLPFAFALARTVKDRQLMSKAMALYHGYPALAENEITRHMASQLHLEGHSACTACQQQGLIHIFRNYCREGRCTRCPFFTSLDS